jgi:lysophospholipase L1-like esterase
MSGRFLRALVTLGAVATAAASLLPACVVNLNDRNSPLENGGVTGPAADCSQVTPLGEGAPAATAKTKLVGRFDLTDPTRPHFDWSGNAMNARFRGTQVTWGAESGIEIVFEQIVDGVATQKIMGGLEPKTVTIDVPPGDHEITVVRSSEALFSDGVFIPFTFGPGTEQLPPIEHPRRIEYIGDSITCGYGDEGTNATCPYDVPIRPELDANGKPVTNAAGEVQYVKIPETQNIYLAYGSIAARRLAADATTLCFSGKGMVLNYREQGVGEGKILNPNDDPDPDAKTTIPDYYLRTIATVGPSKTCKLTDPSKAPDGRGPSADCPSNDCDNGICRCTKSADCCGAADAECLKATDRCVPPPPNTAGAGGNVCKNPDYQAWDFAKDAPQPQVVFINIGTNDFSRDVNQDSISDGVDLGAFRAGYKRFVEFVRSKRPDAQMFLAVPPMMTDKFPFDNARSDFRNTVRSIVDELNAAGDAKIYFIELVEMGVRYGLGCDYHPNLEVHRIMADQVVGAIASKTCWSTVAAP